MEEFLAFVTVDTWTMIFTWANLLILFLLLKKFLFKPVNKMLDERAAQIEGAYKEAEDTKSEAQSIKTEYEQRLMGAREEADVIIKTAVETASMRSDSIVGEANEQARRILEKSQKRIEQEKAAAVNEAKRDVASMAVDVAEKLIGKRLTDSEDDKLITDIIERM